MFQNCKCVSFLPDISKWNIKQIKFHDNDIISSLFKGCYNLITYPDISKWKINKIEGDIKLNNKESESKTSSYFIDRNYESLSYLQSFSKTQLSSNENKNSENENIQSYNANEEIDNFYDNFYN